MAGPLPLGEPWPKNNRLDFQPGEKTFHAYLHIPFCEIRCGYCDFNTYTAEELGGISRAEFHKPLLREIGFSKKVFELSSVKPGPLSSIFFGGGTPSLFAATQISELIQSLGETFGISEDCEITLEANPESTSEGLLDGLKAAGVNRLSFGVQSFDQAVLDVLDRRHRPDLVPKVVEAAKQWGFRTSIDLIYGSPGESLASWGESVAQAIALGTEHISAYSLIVEPGTALARRISKGELQGVDEDLNAQKYELATQFFTSAGLTNYETSNFGQPSVHNLAYWTSQNWWGYGPGAHSHLAGNRFWNHKHPAKYSQLVESSSPAAGIERLTPRQVLEEELMLGLRLSSGVRKELFRELEVDSELVAKQIASGVLTLDGDRIVATEAGRLIVDRLVVDFLA